ncbi:MAG: ExbD/TolR family protein [Myxococcales bacterium]
MAAASQGENDDEMISGINVTPLVDITLVLLIIFMVTATYIVRRAIQVNLPKAANGGEVLGKTFMVVVKADGSVILDGAGVTDAELVSRVRAQKATEPDARVVISADGDARHREVVHVIDVLKGEGVTKFALDVEQADRAAAAGP